MHFVGVTTKKSASVDLFPLWTDSLNIKNAYLNCVDFKLHDDSEKYREFIRFLRDDEQSFGALVTTHKIDLFNATKELFDKVEDIADIFQEVSCIVKDQEKKIHAYAVDAQTSGLAMNRFIPEDYFSKCNSEVMILGAGGSMLAICYALSKRKNNDLPLKIVITNRSLPRLKQAKEKLYAIEKKIKIEYIHCPEFNDNDRVLAEIPPNSLIVNATGLGKDSFGSPLTQSSIFPFGSLIWELNYRGDLGFMHQAIAQKAQQNLVIEDGWKYFIIGWATVVCRVYNIQLNDQILSDFERIANEYFNKRNKYD